jgi:hypothetical protein
MAKPTEVLAPVTSDSPASAVPMSISAADFQAVIAAAMSAATSTASVESAKMLREFMLELKKPYVDPNQAEIDAGFRAQAKEAKERMDRQIRQSQDLCPHLQGCSELSEFTGQASSIVKHRLDNSVVVGICTNCQRVFLPGDKDYVEQIRRKSGNKMSASGIRTFV